MFHFVQNGALKCPFYTAIFWYEKWSWIGRRSQSRGHMNSINIYSLCWRRFLRVKVFLSMWSSACNSHCCTCPSTYMPTTTCPPCSWWRLSTTRSLLSLCRRLLRSRQLHWLCSSREELLYLFEAIMLLIQLHISNFYVYGLIKTITTACATSFCYDTLKALVRSMTMVNSSRDTWPSPLVSASPIISASCRLDSPHLVSAAAARRSSSVTYPFRSRSSNRKHCKIEISSLLT